MTSASEEENETSSCCFSFKFWFYSLEFALDEQSLAAFHHALRWPLSSSWSQLGESESGRDADWSLWFEGFLPVSNPLTAIHAFLWEARSRRTRLLAAVSSEGPLFNAGLLKSLMGERQNVTTWVLNLAAAAAELRSFR